MSQRPFLAAYYDRRTDVERYLATIILAERQINSGHIPKRHESELRMFKAGAMLVLYNAVEASARGGIEAIYDEMAVHRIPFDDLRPELKKHVVQGFKKHFSNNDGDKITMLAHEMIAKSFNVAKVFSGNVDARVIREKSDIYGFSITTDYATTHDGSDLVVVKGTRNDLSHGLVSFGEVGRNYTARELHNLGKRVLRYMEAVLVEIDTYLDNGGYIA